MNLPDYFAICASGEREDEQVKGSTMLISTSRKLAMVDSAPRELSLDFGLEQLQQKQICDSKLFKRQADMLQAIEQ